MALLTAAGSLAGCTPTRAWSSPGPLFTVHYPATWHVSQSSDVSGPVTVFSPKADPGPQDMRIVLLRTTAQPRKPPPEGRQPVNLTLYTDVQGDAENLPGCRWFVTLFPAAVLVEAFAPPEKLDEIKRLGRQMVDDIARARKEEP